MVGPTEEDEEYKLIVQSNSMTADIDNEIQTVHKVTAHIGHDHNTRLTYLALASLFAIIMQPSFPNSRRSCTTH